MQSIIGPDIEGQNASVKSGPERGRESWLMPFLLRITCQTMPYRCSLVGML